jgi:cytochrome c
MKRLLISTVMGLGLLAPAAQAEPVFEQAKVLAGEMLFKAECRRCHAPDSDHDSYGPPLNNIIGRAAGIVENYDYSMALEASGIVWTEAALRAWMEDNDGFMPGTKMRHVGIEDRTVQDFILAYLASISDEEMNKQIDGQ